MSLHQLSNIRTISSIFSSPRKLSTTAAILILTVAASAYITSAPAEASADIKRPTAVITQPYGGSSVGGDVFIHVHATDNVGVQRVEFMIDGLVQAVDTSPAYTYVWSTNFTHNGQHQILVRAVDYAGNYTLTAVNVYVFNIPPDYQPPGGYFAQPAGGSTVTGIVMARVDAWDDRGVIGVEFMVDGAFVGFDGSAPYEFPWDTRQYGNGSHQIVARIIDTSGNSGFTWTDVTVFNPVPDTSSPATGLLPFSTSKVSGTIQAKANIVDNVGVHRAEFAVDNVVRHVDYTAPYEFNWDTTGYSEGYHWLTVRGYDAAGNTTLAGMGFIVDNQQPTVDFSNLTDGSVLSDYAEVSAGSVDGTNLTSYQFSINGYVVQEWQEGGYSFYLDTYGFADGEHELMVEARDTLGHIHTKIITIVVNNYGTIY